MTGVQTCALPIWNLRRDKYNSRDLKHQGNLETAIVQECFGGQQLDEDTFRGLTRYVKEQIDYRPNKVLIVLDGLDERYGANEHILAYAKEGVKTHKLWVSRPYGAEKERNMLAQAQNKPHSLLVENIGFNNEQVEQYVQRYFADKDPAQGQRLLRFLKANPAVYGIAHIPINLQLLCKVWGQDKRSVEQIGDSSLTKLYSMLVDYLWERYTKDGRPTVAVKEGQQKLVIALGTIALAGLEKGKLLIDEGLIRDQLSELEEDLQEDKNQLRELIHDSGFLRATEVKREKPKTYRDSYFLHLTFQEYFAGKELARRLFSADEQERAFATDFLAAHQHEPQYGAMLIFMAGEAFKAQRSEERRVGKECRSRWPPYH